ncbi:AraC family ligand binding domain-containing protein [Spirosoma sp. BT702]|uniref:AraC family ligand binding domain-containing protein n=1 Tax=Spirosoma profusum TaxID=2771354 RepID=A0A927AVS6_9BACT|nr:AraC family ligand binding domain-containing protein [Spirosoma profusum]MBD2705286.1 AraC family ligand binding domain-containing protein [Spirosoma profusum]
MRTFLLLWIVIWTSRTSFAQVVVSGLYSYNQPSVNTHSGYEVRTLLEGTTRDFSHLILQAITLQANQPDQSTLQLEEEATLIIKAGESTIYLGGKRKTMGPGSVVMLMPGDEFRIENKTAQPLTYFMIRFTSNEMPDLDLYSMVGGSFWIDRQEIASRKVLTYSTVMSHRIALQKNTLVSGSKNYEARRAAELLFVLDNPIQVSIGDVTKVAKAGDVIFLDSDVSHRINAGSQEDSTYLSFQF